MAVQLGYKNVYRDPLGYPVWQEQGLPVASAPREVIETAPASVGPFLSWSMLWTLFGVFVGGMALNLTPCVYPLIPITVSYFSGLSGGSRSRLVAHGLAYLGGLSVTNTVLGVAAALTGGLMGAMLQNPVVLLAVAGILLIFATSLFGLWELRLPQSLTQAATKSYAGFFGTLFMGLTLGLVAAPCIGPFVLGLLTWVASQGSAWLGFAVFFTLSLGLGLPLFFLALFSGSLEKLPRSGEWMIWVRKLMGWVLVGLAVHFLRPLLPGSWGIILLGTRCLGGRSSSHLPGPHHCHLPSLPLAQIRGLVCRSAPGPVAGGFLGLAGTRRILAAVLRRSPGGSQAPAKTSDHRFHCHLVFALPGIG